MESLEIRDAPVTLNDVGSKSNTFGKVKCVQRSLFWGRDRIHGSFQGKDPDAVAAR